MIFDKLCKIAEKEIPRLAELLRTIKLFHFPGKPHEFLPKELDGEIVTFLQEQFMLPFSTVAIEDDAGLVILSDIKKDNRGINHERRFIDIVRLNSPDDVFREDTEKNEHAMLQIIKHHNLIHNDPLVIGIGAIEQVNWLTKNNFLTYGRMDRIITAFVKRHNKKHIYSDYNKYTFDQISKELIDRQLKSSMMNAMTAIQEVLYTNTPNRFVVQISPTNKKKHKKNQEKIPRSHQRQKYILLKPKEIRKLIQEELPKTQTGRISPRVHERRAHPRTFHSDKFVHMQGKTIMIPAKWIGVSEKTIGNKHYKVMLDM